MNIPATINLFRHLNHPHPAEHRLLKQANKGKGKVVKGTATHNSELATSQQPQYKQSFKSVSRIIMEMRKEKIADVLLTGELITIFI